MNKISVVLVIGRQQDLLLCHAGFLVEMPCILDLSRDGWQGTCCCFILQGPPESDDSLIAYMSGIHDWSQYTSILHTWMHVIVMVTE